MCATVYWLDCVPFYFYFSCSVSFIFCCCCVLCFRCTRRHNNVHTYTQWNIQAPYGCNIKSLTFAVYTVQSFLNLHSFLLCLVHCHTHSHLFSFFIFLFWIIFFSPCRPICELPCYTCSLASQGSNKKKKCIEITRIYSSYEFKCRTCIMHGCRRSQM